VPGNMQLFRRELLRVFYPDSQLEPVVDRYLAARKSRQTASQNTSRDQPQVIASTTEARSLYS
jgi:hypothetical protein